VIFVEQPISGDMDASLRYRLDGIIALLVLIALLLAFQISEVVAGLVLVGLLVGFLASLAWLGTAPVSN
jgi:hypothetical protein